MIVRVLGQHQGGNPHEGKQVSEHVSIFGGGPGGKSQGSIGEFMKKGEKGQGSPLVQSHGRPVNGYLFRSRGNRVCGVNGTAQQKPLGPRQDG